MRLETCSVESPIGTVHYAVRDQALVALCFPEHWDKTRADVQRHAGEVTWADADDAGDVGARLDAYFGGDLTAIDDIAVELYGTPFQRDVWTALRDIPAGSTTSYAELAQRIDRPSAVRAVGAANGSNPISIVVPCHRVIGANGALTGYGGGLDRKQWLLRHEKVLLV